MEYLSGIGDKEIEKEGLEADRFPCRKGYQGCIACYKCGVKKDV